MTTSRSVTDDGIYSRVLNAIEKAYSCLAVMSGDAAEFKEHVGIYRGEQSHPRVSRIDDDETYVHQSDGDGELVTDCNSMMTTN